jgi:transforming growth factor-beta-induced protein
MKTKIRILGIALVLAVIVTGINASEIRNTLTIESEPKMKTENWMTDLVFFEAKKNASVAGTVVDIAVSNPDFSILVEAVTKADLVGALSSDGPFTVFAPTNEAFNDLFDQLGISGIDDLSKEQLTPILTYHVVSGKVMSTDLSNTSVGTLNTGKKIKIDITNGVKINDSNVVKADISGENGVVHVIDKVLIPLEDKSSGCSN